jgi:hypothetical protein
MKLVYTHYNPMLVALMQGKLESEGIKVEVKNNIAAGGAGELAPTELWPELWVLRRVDEERALAIVQKMMEKGEHGKWECPQCGEENDSSFESCWQCQSAAPFDESTL